MAADLDQSYTVAAADIELGGVSSVVFDYFAFENGTQAVASFDDANELVIPNLQKYSGILGCPL